MSLFKQLAGNSEQERVVSRQQQLSSVISGQFDQLFSYDFDAEKVGSKNCENLIGSVEIPLGLAGPVRVSGESFEKDEELLLPLATTEGALVASINRGCKAIHQSQSTQVFIKKMGMSRAPVFKCQDGQQALDLVDWISNTIRQISKVGEETSNHLTFLNHHAWVRGTYVYARFSFDTDQAMGMNMVTIAARAISDFILQENQGIDLISISSNVCTDKKDSVINRLLGRGYWVQVETLLPQEVVEKMLKTSFARLLETHQTKNLYGSNLAGSLWQNMQAANAIAALFLATGQDPAHVVETAQASTVIEKSDQELYVSVTLPNVNVGVVGGGTWLPKQSQARDLIRQGKPLSAEQLAGVVGVAVLAAEISGLAALSSHSLATAHQKLGRVSE